MTRSSSGRFPSLPVVGGQSAGAGQRPRGRSPFAPAAPSIAVALAYAVALFVWLGVGDLLPGGRWLAVHLFTLGVLTNLVLTFSEHFGRTVTRAPGERTWWWPVVTNAGIVLVLVGVAAELRWALATGGVVVTAAVFAAYRRLRRMRKQAVGARFAWVARMYERAHGAFIHGAVLGVVLGLGVLSGAWYGGVRSAHLHANVLGWGGLTLLATLVFFGPSMARTRIEQGADDRSARALRLGATGLSAGVLLLIASGAPGLVGTSARVAAAVGLAVLAWATTVVCLPVARAALRAPQATAPQLPVVALCVWFPVVVWLDVAVVAAGAWRWLDALGVAILAGVLGQAMLATLTYLSPMLLGRTTAARDRIRERLEIGMRTRTGVFQLGVVLAVLGAARLTDAVSLAGIGWALLATTLAVTAMTAAWPVRAATPDDTGDGAGGRVDGG